MRLLIVDDNVALAWRLQNHFNKQFDVRIARTGSEGRQLAQAERFDAMILDLSLPDIDGQEVCTLLRKSNVNTPILVLSARSATESKTHLLNQGADDYLTKPFEVAELNARIKALIRRQQINAPSSIITTDDLVIDLNRRAVTRAGTPITLRRKEYEILEYLAHHKGTVVTQKMIMDHLWDKTTWGDTIRVHVKHLRDKIDKPFSRPLLKTVRGVGYMLDVLPPK